MEKQLRKKLISVLEEGIEDEIIVSRNRKDIDGIGEHTKIAALLLYAGLLVEVSGAGTFTSLQGREYLARLNAPRMTWFNDHWFAASVAAGTIIFAGVSAGVQSLFGLS